MGKGAAKTKKAAAKRFKITGTGKVKAKKAGLRHNTGKVARGVKRRRRAAGYVFKGDVRHVEDCLPFGSLL